MKVGDSLSMNLVLVALPLVILSSSWTTIQAFQHQHQVSVSRPSNSWLAAETSSSSPAPATTTGGDTPDQSLFARRTIQLADAASQGKSRWGPSENRRAQNLAQSMVLTNSASPIDPPATPVELQDTAMVGAARRLPKQWAALRAQVTQLPTQPKETAAEPVVDDAVASLQAALPKQWAALRDLVGMARLPRQWAALRQEASEPTTTASSPVAPPSSSSSLPRQWAALREETKKTELARPFFGDVVQTTTKEETPAEQVVPQEEAAAAPVVGTALSGPKLFEARTLQVAAAAEAGMSRWGAPENRRAAMMAAALAGTAPAVAVEPTPAAATTAPPAETVPPKAEESAALVPKQKPSIAALTRSMESRWSNLARSPAMRGTSLPIRAQPRPQLASFNKSSLLTRNNYFRSQRVLTGGNTALPPSTTPSATRPNQFARRVLTGGNTALPPSTTPSATRPSQFARRVLTGGNTALPPSTTPNASRPNQFVRNTRFARAIPASRPTLASPSGSIRNVISRRQISVNTDEQARPVMAAAVIRGRKAATPPKAQEPSAPPAAPPVPVTSTPAPAAPQVQGPPGSSVATAAPAPPITEAEVRALFNLWNDALATLDSTTVAERYAADPILLPTVSDEPRTDFASIKDYFDNFLKLQPQGVIVEGKVKIGPNWAQDAGIYEFTMGTTGAKVRARYSFVYVFEEGEWKIAHHHSSTMPEAPETVPTEDEVKGFFTLWNDALATLDSDTVAQRYAQNAVLLPTVSDVPRTDYASIKDYFDNFLQLKPEGVILDSFVTTGKNLCKDVGIYEFTLGATGEKVRARYSFVYIKEGMDWKISHHHSSVMPEAQASSAISEEEVRDLFTLWNDALATLDSDKVASRYAKESVLLATVSDVPRTDYASKKAYFDDFLKKEPQGEILESFVEIGDGWCKDVGIYEFTMGTTGEKVKGRYSFLYSFEDGEWKILHHHSSIMPESIL